MSNTAAPTPLPTGTGGMADGGERQTLTAFAEFEHYYLLQYIYFADIRGAAVFAALGGAIAFYFTKQIPDHSIWLSRAWIACTIYAFALVGVALCPIPRRQQLPPTGTTATRHAQKEIQGVYEGTSVTNYLDVAHFATSEDYLHQILCLYGEDAFPNALVEEMLQECHRLAIILAFKMRWLTVGLVLAGLALLSLILDLSMDTSSAAICNILLTFIGAVGVFGALWWFMESKHMRWFWGV